MWKNSRLEIPLSALNRTNELKYTSSAVEVSSLAQGQSAIQFFVGSISGYVSTSQLNVDIGSVWVDYEVELSEP